MVAQEERSFSEFLEEICSYYMLCGVSYHDFWNGDYTQLKFYARAHKLAVEQKSQEMWLQGLYNYDAVSKAIHNNFRNRGEKSQDYMDKPIRITERNKLEKEEESKEILNKVTSQLNAMTRKFEKHHEQKSGELSGS